MFSPRRERPDTAKQPQQSLGRTLSAARLPASAAFGVLEIGMIMRAKSRRWSASFGHTLPRHSNRPRREFFNSVEDIARAKGRFFRYRWRHRDHQPRYEVLPLLSGMAQDAGAGQSSRSPAKDSDMRLIECRSDVTGNAIKARWRGDALYHVAQPGVHWVNSLAVLAAADAMGINLEKAAADLATIPALRAAVR